MIKSLKIKNYRGKTMTLDLAEISEDGIYIKTITGLGPVTAKVNTTDVAGYDGSIFNTSQLEERDINIKFGIAEVYSGSTESARQKLYEMFTPKRPVTLTFLTDNRHAFCEGYVRICDPDIFSKDVSLMATIVCPDPAFYDANGTGVQITTFYGLESAFEFPFSNESLTDNLIEFGVMRRNTSGNIHYVGEMETGCVITIHALGDVGTITIYNTQTKEKMILDADKLEALTGSPLKYSDTIIINTNRNKKSVRLLRDGVYTNVLNIIARNSDWFKIVQGDNLFAYTASEGLYNVQFKIENKIAYGGI
jgi:hypothetical protein